MTLALFPPATILILLNMLCRLHLQGGGGLCGGGRRAAIGCSEVFLSLQASLLDLPGIRCVRSPSLLPRTHSPALL